MDGINTVVDFSFTFFGVLVFVPFSEEIAGILTHGQTKHLFPRQIQGFLCVLAFGFLIYVFASPRGFLAQILSQPWLVYLGNISFSIYMLQGLVAAPVGLNLHVISLGWGLYILALIISSGLTYAFVETPARKFIVARTNSLLRRTSDARPRKKNG